MQAIILAAGMGNRLGNLTRYNAKCMVKVNGITLIERILHQLDRLNLEKITIVIGYEGEKLRCYIDSLLITTKIDYVTNPVYESTNNIYSLYLAKDIMLSSDFLLLESDLIVDDTVLPKFIGNPLPDLALVARYETWMDGTVVTMDEFNNITRFIPKKDFSSDESTGYYKTVNIYKFSRRFSSNLYIPFLEAYIKAFGCNDYYEQVLRIISFLDVTALKAHTIGDDKWYEVDNARDLEIAESIFTDE